MYCTFTMHLVAVPHHISELTSKTCFKQCLLFVPYGTPIKALKWHTGTITLIVWCL